MSDDKRARADAPGSREPSPDGLGPSGFDPSRGLRGAIERGRQQGKLALYFGADPMGHYLHHPRGQKIWDVRRDLPGFPWSDALLDAGLLKNGERRDVYDGKVYWTCGGTAFWYAFFWWDRSGDKRSASNSGFYVRGFGWPETTAAFEYACATFPRIVARQLHPLILQNPRDSDGSGVAGETAGLDPKGDSADPQGIAQTAPSPNPNGDNS